MNQAAARIKSFRANLTFRYLEEFFKRRSSLSFSHCSLLVAALVVSAHRTLFVLSFSERKVASASHRGKQLAAPLRLMPGLIARNATAKLAAAAAAARFARARRTMLPIGG